MTNPFNQTQINSEADRLNSAVDNNDGISSARILEECGAMNWNSVINQAKSKRDVLDTIATSDELLPNNIEKLTLIKINESGANHIYVPVNIATVQDVRPDKK